MRLLYPVFTGTASPEIRTVPVARVRLQEVQERARKMLESYAGALLAWGRLRQTRRSVSEGGGSKLLKSHEGAGAEDALVSWPRLGGTTRFLWQGA